MDACLEGARASFLAAPAFALTGDGAGPAPAAPPAPNVAVPASDSSSHGQGDGELLRLRQEVEELRRENRRTRLILDGIRAALVGDNANPAGG
jgi:hypothetical protein